jgi:hypothetical protein
VESVPGSLQFALVDPADHKFAPLIVEPGYKAEAMNLTQHRKTESVYDSTKRKTDYFEKVSLFAFEGSTLTLMGLVKYDAKTDQLKMTDVTGIVAGGFKECNEIIKKEIMTRTAYAWIIGGLTCVAVLIGGAVIYSKYSEWRTER